MAGIAVMSVLILVQLRSLVAITALAVLLAYIFNPAVELLMRVRLSRTGATAITYLLLLLALVILSSLIIPPLVSQIAAINVDFQAVFNGLRDLILRYQRTEIMGFSIDLEGLYQGLQTELAGFLNSVATYLVRILSGALTSALWLIFILVISFWLLKDADKATRYLDGLVPPEYRDDMETLKREIGETWNSFLRGQILLSIVVGVLVAISLWLVGLKNALLLGLLAGVLEIVPTLGPIIATVPAVSLAFFQGSERLAFGGVWFALLIAAIYILIQQVESNLLVPRIIGKSVNLHPVVVMLGAVGGAALGGILGVFLAAPLLATARTILGYVYRKILEEPPPPQSPQGEPLPETET
jgi:predicted PurR-regulated permease PerM